MIFRFRLASRLAREFGWSWNRAWRVAGEHLRVR